MTTLCGAVRNVLAAEAGADNSLGLPVALRIPINGKFGNRVALVSMRGELLHAPDLTQVLDYRKLGGRVLPTPAKAGSGLWGYLDARGQWLATPQYLDAKSFTQDGFARVKTKAGWGFVDGDLKPVVAATFEAVEGMLNGRAAFKSRGRWGYVDATGATVIPPRYEEARRFDADGLAAVKLDGKFGVVDRQGAVVVPPKFDLIGPFGANGLARVSQSERWGYIDRQGRQVIPLRYSLALDFGASSAAAVELNDLRGLIDERGDWVMKPAYGRIGEFNEDGLAPVWDKNYAIGFVDGAGELAIPPGRGIDEVVRAGLIRNGGKGDSNVSYLDKTGKVAIKGPFEWGGTFAQEGTTVARQDGRWGILDRQGRFVVPPHHVEPLTNHERNFQYDAVGRLWPWLTTDQAIEWLDSAGKTIFRVEQTGGAKGPVGLRLANAKGESIWQGATPSGKLDARPFFEPSAQDLLHDSGNWVEVARTARTLLSAKPRKFVAQQGWERERNPYVMPDDDDEIEDGLRHGAIENLAVDYVSEEEWGTFYFLQDQRAGKFDELYKALRDRLTEAFGQPAKATTEQDRLAGADKETRTVWAVGKQRLVLEWTTAYGDGDITHHLVLAAIQPKGR